MKKQREIKFRAKLIGKWNIRKSNEWIFFDLKLMDEKLRRFPIDWNTVCEFTGLLDKDGKEIYEGDVLGYPKEEGGYEYYEVRWVKNGWMTVWLSYLGKEVTNYLDSDYVVLGNIYENPELLKIKHEH